MPTEKTVLLYQFAELSDEAKGVARDWYRGCIDSSDYSMTIEDFAECVALLGVDLDRRSFKTYGGGTGSEPDVRWTLSYSQGDGAAFSGRYAYAKGGVAAIVEHTGNTEGELIRIAKALQALQAKHFYGLTARMSDGHGSNFYSHSGTMSVDVEDRRGEWPGESVEGELEQLMRDLGDWLYDRLKSEDEWLNADEQVDESILANEYTFTESGKRED